MKITVTLLVIMNLFLLAFIIKKKPITIREDADPFEKLTLLYGKEYVIRENDWPVLYIFFNVDASCGCLEDWPNWVEAANTLGDKMIVRGIFTGEDKTKLTGFSNGFQLNFPIYDDPDKTMSRRLRVPNKLTKVLVDSHQRILFSDSYQIEPHDQDYFLARLRGHLERMQR